MRVSNKLPKKIDVLDYYKYLDIDCKILLDKIKKEFGVLTFNIICLYLCGFNISEICRLLKISRFVANKRFNRCKGSVLRCDVCN